MLYTMHMDLGTAQQILVIILAVALAIFLILGIVIAVLVIRFMKTLQAIAERAENVVATAESAAEMLRNASIPMTVLRFARSIGDMLAKRKDNQK